MELSSADTGRPKGQFFLSKWHTYLLYQLFSLPQPNICQATTEERKCLFGSQSILVGKPQRQSPDPAGHTASTVKTTGTQLASAFSLGGSSTGWCCYLGGSSHLSKAFLEKLVKMMINCDSMLRVGDKEPFLGPLGAQESGVGATDSSDISVQHLGNTG